MSNSSLDNKMEIIEDDSFSYEGFQVVRGEFFAHIYEPSFTFSNNKVFVNTACIKKLPEFDYVQILVNPDERKLAVRPCKEEEKDSFRWCSATAKRSPKQITCRMFFAKVMSLMNWNINYRYKVLGKLIRSGGELLFVFDLESAEIYKQTVKDDGKSVSSRTPSYPEDWKTQFGLPIEEHKSTIQVNTFKGYAVFGLQKEETQPAKNNSTANTDNLDKNQAITKESEDITNGANFEQLNLNTFNDSLNSNRYACEPHTNSQSNLAPIGQS